MNVHLLCRRQLWKKTKCESKLQDNMDLPRDILDELGPDGKLHGFEKPMRKDIEIARKAFPQLAEQYWTFIEHVGIGEAVNSGASACLPYYLTHESNHPSLLLYRGSNFQRLRSYFGGDPPHTLRPLPSNVAVVSRPGASWFYCLKNNGDQTCYTYDLASQELEPSYDDFFAFIRESLV